MKTSRGKRLDELHSLYERALDTNPSKQRRQGAKAMKRFSESAEKLKETEARLKALTLEVSKLGNEKRALKAKVSELTEELVTCFGKGPLVIDGQAWYFGEDQFGKVYAFSHKPRVT